MTPTPSKLRPVDIVQKILNSVDPVAQQAYITTAWDDDLEEFFVGLELACNPTIDFDLERVPEIQDEDDGEPGEFTFDDFYNLAIRLARGELYGPAARKAIEDAALTANITEWNFWYRRILLKTLPKILPMALIGDTLTELTKR